MSKSDDQPIQYSHGLDEAMKKIQELEQALAERGLTCHSGSALGSLFANVRRLADDTKRQRMSDQKWRRTFFKANEALRIARAVTEALDDDGAKEAIHRVRASDMHLDTRQCSSGKDALWELDLLRRFKLGKTSVRFEEPDLVISLGETYGDYAIACKKIYSENNVADHFDLGCDQIARHGRPGIVAFNLDDLVPEGEAWEFSTQRELRQKLNAVNQDFILSNEFQFRSAIARGECDGVLVSTSVISTVHDMTPPINVSHVTSSWCHEAGPEAQARFKTFLICLDGLLKREAGAD